jgi:hypothetical protein
VLLGLGELAAVTLDSAGGSGSVVWRASEKLPAPGNRSIFTLQRLHRGVPFTLVEAWRLA